MAKIFFVGLDGTEKSYRLQTHRPFTVGRDPGNDIILRDPKVSRHHAEIIFERGFFVLHDLASANGTYVREGRPLVSVTAGSSGPPNRIRLWFGSPYVEGAASRAKAFIRGRAAGGPLVSDGPGEWMGVG